MKNAPPTRLIDSNEKQGTIADHICHQLKNDIIEGKLAQGSKIIEEDLAKDYGSSRGPIREAIRRLEGMRLVERVPHAGARVVTLTAEIMHDLYIVREALEGMSARLAAKQMDDSEVNALWELIEVHEQAVDNKEGEHYFLREGDLDFHFRIAHSSGNKWLIHLLGSELYQLMRICRHRSASVESRSNVALSEHRHIVEAIAKRDGELAEMLMRRHITGAWDIVKELVPYEACSDEAGING